MTVQAPITPAAERGPDGRILTFYSYKGGTGRSMLLANVAWVLASTGRKVLVIDWDLEAPGLHRYFFPFLQDKDLTWSDGVINFVDDYRTQALTPPPEGEEPTKDWYVRHVDIRRYAVSLDWSFPAKGQLDFVPAGRQDATYSPLVNGFNWEDFYKRLGGKQFLEKAKEVMRREYDYVLIDSRTGVSDTSGICTITMPDALVVCFTLNYQSINGAASVADYVYAQKQHETEMGPFNVFPVPMRLEDAQTRKLERRREYARVKKFARYPIRLHANKRRQDYWSEVGVRYYSFYAYEELLAAFGERTRDVGSLLSTVQRVTTYLTEGTVDPNLALPQPRREEILRLFEGDASDIGTDQTGLQGVEDAFASLTPEQRDVARSVLLRLVRVAGPQEAEHARQIVPIADFEPAAQAVIQALVRYQVLTTDSLAGSSETLVQIAPEVPLQAWPQLQEWIAADSDFLIWRQRLRPRAEEWNPERRQLSHTAVATPWDASLLTGAELTTGVSWLRSRGSELSPLMREFIGESLAADDRAREAQVVRDREEYEHRRKSQLDSRPARPVSPTTSAGPLRRAFENLFARFRRARPPKARTPPRSEPALEAWEVLNGKIRSPGELLTLARKLKNEQAFSLSRRVLARAIANPALDADRSLRVRIFQQSALCTYKDNDLPADDRLESAMELLRRAEDLATTVDQETLGLAGAIHKRKWEIDSQKSHLERSLDFYWRGYQQGVAGDQGYTGINAAFVLDLLAFLETRETTAANDTSTDADERRSQARSVRQDIVRHVTALIDRPGYEWLSSAWWFYSTVAEALFGLGRYGEATAWLQRGITASGNVPEWEYQSTLQQLARLAVIQANDMPVAELEHHESWKALTAVFGNDAVAVKGAFIGKVGLALSGGGFRAALFHIGVLARLAELDVLRHVEVLSCVSGGSIVGAHYYLEVRNLLQSKADEDVTREDYIELVRRIERDFVAGVQSNVRTRVLAEFLTSLRMFLPGYSRTLRVGELYERDIYSRIRDGENDAPRWLPELNVRPLGEPDAFAPKFHNWRRRAKVPILVVNATTLNTGHNWQFTTSWMGEPPARIDADVDGNEQLRRMYYWEAPEGHRQIRLGHAVAASSCVPGLFEPLSLVQLYPDRVVRLVDGGVCDNQGVAGLLEQDCTVMLVSDGSGQSESQRTPSDSRLGVPLRANTILQARVRDAQYQELRARRRASLLRGMMFVHLKDDLDVDPIDWIDCPDPYQASDETRPAERRRPITRYGISKEVQSLLASVRTDLDSFSDVEAAALMTSGYRMTEYQFKYSLALRGLSYDATSSPWEFLAAEQGMKGPGQLQSHLKRLLSVAGSLSFKVWRLSAPLQVFGLLLAISLLWLGTLFYERARGIGWQLGAPAEALGVGLFLVMGSLIGATAVGIIHVRAVARTVAAFAAMLGSIAARLHLLFFDRLFLNIGSIERFRRMDATRR